MMFVVRSVRASAVFTTEDIETLGSHSIADVLRYVPGLNIESTGREGQLASVFARGGESDYNHVLIDGVRVNDTAVLTTSAACRPARSSGSRWCGVRSRRSTARTR